MVHIDMDMFGQGYGTYRYGYVWSGLWYIQVRICLVGAMIHIDMDMFGWGYGTCRYGYVWSWLWYI